MKRLISLISLFALTAMINPADAQVKAKKNYEEVQIKTSAVCGMCEERIETNIVYEKGVKKVELDDVTKIVTIGFDPKKTDPDSLRKAISELGYDADDIPANKEAYDKLPACCQKGSKPH